MVHEQAYFYQYKLNILKLTPYFSIWYPGTLMAIGLVIALYAVWSSVFSIGKIALSYSPPFFLTGARMLLGGAILFAVLCLFRRAAMRITRYQFFALCLLAFFSTYLSNAFEFWGLQHLSAAKACFIYSLSPFFAALFSYLHFNERMTGRKWIGLGIGFIAIVPILAVQTGSEGLIGGLGIFSWAELALLGAVLASSYGWVLLRLLVKDSAISPLMTNASSMLIGGCMALVHSWIVEPWNPLPIASQNTIPFLNSILLLTLISNIVCYNVYGYLLRRFTATVLSFVGLLSPVFASLTSWLLLGEAPNPVIFAGTGLFMLGLWLVYSSELRQGYILRPAKDSA